MRSKKDKADIYTKLYETQTTLFFSRVNVEWKVFISALTALVVATGYLAPKIDVNITLIIFFISFSLLYITGWMYGLWKANEVDKRWAAVYRNEAEILIGLKKKKLKYIEPKKKEFFKDWSMIGQMVLLNALLFLSLWIIHIVGPGKTG